MIRVETPLFENIYCKDKRLICLLKNVVENQSHMQEVTEGRHGKGPPRITEETFWFTNTKVAKFESPS